MSLPPEDPTVPGPVDHADVLAEETSDQSSFGGESAVLQSDTWLTEPIGVCFSGGGYRAAGFHLGTLDYLQRFGLLDQLTAISTVSGGTFTGAKYVLSQIEKRCYEDFFADYYRALETTNLVADGLSHLASRSSDVASGRQDLIVSMAEVYSTTFFARGDGNHEPYYFDSILDQADPTITDVVFNATDFRSGVAFRFQRSRDSKALIGNYYNSIDAANASEIRLGDIVAASSCFPGGFEPLSFPYDFSWKSGCVPAGVAARYPKREGGQDSADPQGPVALMDGGVYDNQGLQSLLLANQRLGNELSLFVISDVDQPSLDMYPMPLPEGNGGLRLSTVRRLAQLMIALCAITIAALTVNAVHDYQTNDLSVLKLIFLYAIPFVLASGAGLGLLYLYRVVKHDVLPLIPKVGSRAWDSLKRLTTGQLRNMVRLRLSSLLTLTSSVFMRRIRDLVYKLIYGDRGQPSDPYAGKRVSNLIYSLSPAKTSKPLSSGVDGPCEQLSKVCSIAFKMKTTLWFDEPYQLACLTSAGQASLCFNLMKLIVRQNGDDPSQYPAIVKERWDLLTSDWRAFNQDPFWRLEQQVDADWQAIREAVEKVVTDWGMFAARELHPEELL